MALASGIPVPPVYVLDNEPGINAFAAGHQPGDAVVAVSRGCLDYLTREELQGVMGHEFSHILNGDMRLNLRLIGVVFGILVLAVIGYYIMRSASLFSSRDSKRAGAATAAFFLGLTLLVLGYLGVFLGKLIKSAISRQREFLADASSVQFTRYPGGIAGALKKIGGLAEGSRIRDAHAEEISHMFFGDAFAGSLLNLFATHPPLVGADSGVGTRLRRPLPRSPGRRHHGRGRRAHRPRQPPSRFASPCRAGSAARRDRGGHGAGCRAGGPRRRPAADGTPRPCRPDRRRHAAGAVGRRPRTVFRPGGDFLAPLEPRRRRPCPGPGNCNCSKGPSRRPLFQEVQQLAGPAQSLPAASRLPLVDLTVPALKKASPQQYGEFRRVVEALVAAEHRVELFEYCLRIVLLQLPRRPLRAEKAAGGPLSTVWPPSASRLASSSPHWPMPARATRRTCERAFQAGAEKLAADAATVTVALLPRSNARWRPSTPR